MVGFMKISFLTGLFLLLPLNLYAQSALVIDFEANQCALLDGNGKIVNAISGKRIVTNSDRDGVSLTCMANVTAPKSGKEAVFDKDDTGYVCYTWKGYTEDWQNTVSVKGDSKLVCRYKN